MFFAINHVAFADGLINQLLPARAARLTLTVERAQCLFGFRWRYQRSNDPCDRGAQYGQQELHAAAREQEITDLDIEQRFTFAMEAERQHDSHRGREDHGEDFAVGIDAPPEPAQQVDGAGSRTGEQQEVERLGGIRQRQGQESRQDHQRDCADAPHAHHVLFRGILLDEALIEIVDGVGRSPVQVGSDCRHVGGDDGGDDQSKEAGA